MILKLGCIKFVTFGEFGMLKPINQKKTFRQSKNDDDELQI